jgi:DNA-binding MarR family transcriptional regulator
MTSQVLSTQTSSELAAWVRLLRGHAALIKDLSASLARQHDLTINGYEALLLLAGAEDNRMRRIDMADALMLSPSGITRLLDGLGKQGYVERQNCPTDARVGWAVLTDAGRAKFEEASATHQEDIRRAVADRFDADELAKLTQLLERLPQDANALTEACDAAAESGADPLR